MDKIVFLVFEYTLMAIITNYTLGKLAWKVKVTEPISKDFFKE